MLCVGHRRGRYRKSSSAASLSGMCWLRCLCVAPSPVPFREIAFTKEASVVGKYFFFSMPPFGPRWIHLHVEIHFKRNLDFLQMEEAPHLYHAKNVKCVKKEKKEFAKATYFFNHRVGRNEHEYGEGFWRESCVVLIHKSPR